MSEENHALDYRGLGGEKADAALALGIMIDAWAWGAACGKSDEARYFDLKISGIMCRFTIEKMKEEAGV